MAEGPFEKFANTLGDVIRVQALQTLVLSAILQKTNVFAGFDQAGVAAIHRAIAEYGEGSMGSPQREQLDQLAELVRWQLPETLQPSPDQP